MTPDTALLTRPEADSERVAGRLSAHGIATATWPLTRIVPVSSAAAVPPGTDGLVFTSQNAVVSFATACDRRDLTAWCVGARTARAAREAGFREVVSADGDVSDLADLLRTGTCRRLLYLRGREVSADLEALLAGSGIELDSRIVYAAEPGGPPSPRVRALLEQGRIAVIAIWSRRAARVLADHLALNPGWPLDRTGVVAISGRAAEPLVSCGVAEIRVSDQPTGAAMEAAISAAVRQKNE